MLIAFDMNMSGVTAAETREQMAVNAPAPLSGTNYLPWRARLRAAGTREYSIKGDNLTSSSACSTCSIGR